MRGGLLGDGSWYEGENYHLFAHRGLWYGVTMAMMAGLPPAEPLLARFDEGFPFPLATALPDLTLPSRKDSQYAISIRQPRFAESFELGLARREDARLAGALARLYTADIPRGDSGRLTTTADVERNLPATALTRADLGWRALLCARAALPSLETIPLQSAHLEGQGITVFRRQAGRVYVALDWGQTGGGHGHPDRLNLTFADAGTRVLDDLGTGSYVDASLHWYRSTLAHNAPLINGRSQRRVAGHVLAHDERGGVGWVLAAVTGLDEGVTVERAVIVTPDYFVDEVVWHANRPVRFELPVHFDANPDVALAPAALDGGTGIEDGFAFAERVRQAAIGADRVVALSPAADGPLRAWICAESEAGWFEAWGPGQPASTLRRFHLVRCEGARGAIRSVWTWTPRVTSAVIAHDTVRVTLGAEAHVHRRTPEYWQLEMTAGHAQSGIELFGWRTRADAGTTVHGTPAVPRAPALTLQRGAGAVVVELAEAHYRRSEETWEEAGRPTATVALSVRRDELDVRVRVRTPHIVFVPADAVNAFDNEHPDINGHSVQCFVAVPAHRGAWVISPERDTGRLRARAVAGWGAAPINPRGWERTPDGFALEFSLPLGGGAGLAFDLIVNDAAPGRMRRRGQLVLSGVRDEFVYLRGDRHDPAAMLHLIIR